MSFLHPFPAVTQMNCLSRSLSLGQKDCKWILHGVLGSSLSCLAQSRPSSVSGPLSGAILGVYGHNPVLFLPSQKKEVHIKTIAVFSLWSSSWSFFILYQVPEKAYFSLDHQSKALRIEELMEQGERCGCPPSVECRKISPLPWGAENFAVDPGFCEAYHKSVTTWDLAHGRPCMCGWTNDPQTDSL